MSTPTLILIAALAKNRVIGCQGRLPWHLPEDLARFKQLTWGHPIIMGKHTWASLGRPLPGRRNIVLSRETPDTCPCPVECHHSLASAIEACHNASSIFIIGGETLYRQSLPIAHRMELTLIDADYIGDAHFPQWSDADWQIVSICRGQASTFPHPFSFISLRRKR